MNTGTSTQPSGPSLPAGVLDDIAAAKANAAAAKAATDALALREDANEQGDVAQGTAIASNGARLVAVEAAILALQNKPSGSQPTSTSNGGTWTSTSNG